MQNKTTTTKSVKNWMKTSMMTDREREKGTPQGIYSDKVKKAAGAFI